MSDQSPSDESDAAPHRVPFDGTCEAQRKAFLLDRACLAVREHDAIEPDERSGNFPIADSEDILLEMRYRNRTTDLVVLSRRQLRALVEQAVGVLESG